jgi:hypothetical protein
MLPAAVVPLRSAVCEEAKLTGRVDNRSGPDCVGAALAIVFLAPST